MTDEILIRLALKAMQDDGALPVLEDAIMESGYTDFNVANLSVKLGYLVTEQIANNYASAVAAVRPRAGGVAWIFEYYAAEGGGSSSLRGHSGKGG